MTRNFRGWRQLPLAGITLPLEPVYPLFFAIVPDNFAVPQIVQTARRLQVRDGLTGTFVPSECLHVTLHEVRGSGPQYSLISKACQAAASLKFPAFDVTFDQAVNFDRNTDKERQHPIVLCGSSGMEKLQEFYRVLAAKMARTGLRPSARGFTPHITLLYSRDRVKEPFVEKLGWTAREFVLVQSLYGQTRHVVLARWALGGERAARN